MAEEAIKGIGMLRRAGCKVAGLNVEGASSSREQPLAGSQPGRGTLEPHLQGTEFSDHLGELGKASFSRASRQQPAGASATVSGWETLSWPPALSLRERRNDWSASGGAQYLLGARLPSLKWLQTFLPALMVPLHCFLRYGIAEEKFDTAWLLFLCVTPVFFCSSA